MRTEQTDDRNRTRPRPASGTHGMRDRNAGKEAAMQDVTITDRNNTTLLVSPYNRDMPAEARRIGGRWNPTLRAWEFDIRDHDKVERLAAKYYGYTPSDTGRTVTIRINAYEYVPDDYRRYNEIVLAGRIIGRRPSRDSDVRLARNVILHSGAFADRGGSRNSPCIIGDNNDQPEPVLEIRDLPAGTLELLDREGKHYELVEGDPMQALREERERLMQRVNEIDRLLAA